MTEWLSYTPETNTTCSSTMLQHKNSRYKKINVYFILMNCLPNISVMSWPEELLSFGVMPPGFEQDTGSLNWRSQTFILPSLGKLKNHLCRHQYVLKALFVFACVTKVESTGLSDMELNNYPTTMLLSSRWVIPVSPLFRETQSVL